MAGPGVSDLVRRLIALRGRCWRAINWPALSTVVTAAATVVIAAVGILQWWTLRDQLNEMQSSSKQTDQNISILARQADIQESQARAWVAPIGISFNSLNKTLSVALHMTNPGRVPATNVTWSDLKPVFVDYIPVDGQIPPRLANDTCDAIKLTGNTVFWPGNNVFLPVVIGSDPHTMAGLGEVIGKSKSLILLGCIKYLSGTAPAPHKSEFQFLWRDDEGVPYPKWNFNELPGGNPAD
jgi:hypothetical protein